MNNAIPEIHEDAATLEQRMLHERNAQLKQRLHMLWLLKTGQCTTRGEVAFHLAVHRKTVGRWLNQYATEGLEALLTLGTPGAPQGQRSLSEEIMAALKEQLQDTHGFVGYTALHHWVQQEHEVQIPYQTFWRIVRYELKAKLKVPRKSHIKKDQQEVQAFREELPEHLSRLAEQSKNAEQNKSDAGKSYERVRVLVQDESRFGLLPMTQRRLTARGVKPIQEVYPRYKSYYLYGAIEPLTGDAFFLELPALDSDWFQGFLDELADTTPEDFLILILDNGAFHKAERLEIPDNMALLFLPPYSPELNPIERFWQHLKKQVAFPLFETLEQLKDAVAHQLKKCDAKLRASITGFQFIIDAVNGI